VLKRLSQETQTKLVVVAGALVRTRELPAGRDGRPTGVNGG
jgi:hypothetical protein